MGELGPFGGGIPTLTWLLRPGHPQSRTPPLRTALSFWLFREKTGAGDEIRTHDPNLGKVVLYP